MNSPSVSSPSVSTAPAYRYPVTPRYFEFDQQGIVFNAWYLAWFDDAQAGYFAARGVPMGDLIAGGHDVRLVRTQVEWAAPVVPGMTVEVDVATAALGRTSVTLQFTVLDAAGSATCRARTVYVVVDTDGFRPAQIPEYLRQALG